MESLIFVKQNVDGKNYEDFIKKEFGIRPLEIEYNDDNYLKILPKYSPLIALGTDNNNYRFLYYGKIAGKEITALKDIIKLIEFKKINITKPEKKLILSVNKKISVKLFITPNCPFCVKMVETLTNCLIINECINVEIFNVFDIQELINKFDITAVPLMIINDNYRLLGFHDLNLICMHMLSAIN